jgi:hypothetical protein
METQSPHESGPVDAIDLTPTPGLEQETAAQAERESGPIKAGNVVEVLPSSSDHELIGRHMDVEAVSEDGIATLVLPPGNPAGDRVAYVAVDSLRRTPHNPPGPASLPPVDSPTPGEPPIQLPDSFTPGAPEPGGDKPVY